MSANAIFQQQPHGFLFDDYSLKKRIPLPHMPFSDRKPKPLPMLCNGRGFREYTYCKERGQRV